MLPEKTVPEGRDIVLNIDHDLPLTLMPHAVQYIPFPFLGAC